MKLEYKDSIEWILFLSDKRNTKDVERFDDYALANAIMRDWAYNVKPAYVPSPGRWDVGGEYYEG